MVKPVRAFVSTALAIGLGLPLPAAAEPGKSVRLAPEPGSSWVLDYKDDRCRLGRMYERGEERSVLFFEQFEPSSWATLTFAGPLIRSIADASKYEIRFGPIAYEPREMEQRTATLSDFGPALIAGVDFNPEAPEYHRGRQSDDDEDGFAVTGLSQIDAAKVEGIDWMLFSAGSSEVTIDLPQFKEAMAALNHCTRDLLASWGLDLDKHLTMTRKVEPLNLATVVQEIAQRYPYRAVRDGEQGILALRVNVAATGEVTGCEVTGVTRIEELGPPACGIFRRRGKFAPALDAAGNPMASYYMATMIYKLR